jgi:hypothetical protein
MYMAASGRKALVKKLDTVFSEYIRARDKGRCVTCGSLERPTCGHIFSRSAYSTRWDEENAFCQCWGCNYKHEFDPYPLTEYAREYHGQDKYDEVHRRYNTTHKFSDDDLKQLIEKYKELKKDL